MKTHLSTLEDYPALYLVTLLIASDFMSLGWYLENYFTLRAIIQGSMYFMKYVFH